MGSLRIYLNTSALNRPFDDLSSERVRTEAEAVVAILSAVESGRVRWFSSEYLEFEVGQNPDGDRARRVRELLALARGPVKLTAALAARARELEQHGLRGLDALHVAAAEAARADALVTTDDRMVRAAARAGTRVRVRVVRPAEALALMTAEEAR